MAAEITETPDKQHLGPSIIYPINYIIHSRWFYVGILLIVLPVLFRAFHGAEWLAKAAPWDSQMVSSSEYKGVDMHLGLIAALIGLLVTSTTVANAFYGYATISYDYTTSPRPLLYVSSGLLSRKIDNIDLSIVVDCDITRRPLDFLFGTGNLHVQLIDGEKYDLRSVEDVFKARDLILAQRPLMASIHRT